MASLKGMFSKARASLQRRIHKKIEDYKAMQKRKKALEQKIRAAQRQAFQETYWKELERAAIEKAKEQARLKARQKVQRGLTWQERLARISEQARKTRTADLLGFKPSGIQSKSPAEMILGTKKKRKED